MILRICTHSGCTTQLSRFNPGPECWTHTRYITETDHPMPHVTKRTHITQKGIMSAEFLENVGGAYEITAAERRDWARGGGAY